MQDGNLMLSTREERRCFRFREGSGKVQAGGSTPLQKCLLLMAVDKHTCLFVTWFRTWCLMGQKALRASTLNICWPVFMSSSHPEDLLDLPALPCQSDLQLHCPRTAAAAAGKATQQAAHAQPGLHQMLVPGHFVYQRTKEPERNI